MHKTILTLALAAVATASAAQNQNSPIGRWKTLDDKTGKPMTITEVYKAKNGTLAAKIVENLGLPNTCAECSGTNKDKPIVGMVTIWNMKDKNDGIWGGGSGYKPSEDVSFNAKSMRLLDGGAKLEVKGCKSIFCRTATWVRVK
jgi:uncharacterized protein (DUF2147 family)